MKLTSLLVVVVTLSLAIPTSAQEIVWPKLEAIADYSYMRFASTNPYTARHALLGGGGSLIYNWNEFLGLQGEVQAYTSNTNIFSIPRTTGFPSGLTGSAQGNMITYLFGPEIKTRYHNFQPFGHLLFGGAHTNIYDVIFRPLCPGGGACNAKVPSADSFAMEFGGGLDIPITKSISFRPVQIDYLLTRFSNTLTRTSVQNNFHYSAGLVFTLARGTY
jgi:hypothetical protein